MPDEVKDFGDHINPGNQNYVKNIEDRQSYKIGCLEEISFNNSWIQKKNILSRIKKYKNSKYSSYLKDIINN